MVRSEYESTVTLHAIVPANVPRLIAYGCFAEDAARWWYLQEWREMRDVEDVNDEVFLNKFMRVGKGAWKGVANGGVWVRD